MALGQAAAVIAGQALREKCAVQDVAYAGVRERLLQAGQAIELAAGDAVPNEIV